MNLYSAPLNFKSYYGWNDFMNAIRRSGALLKVTKAGLFSKGRSKALYNFNQVQPGTTTSIIYGLPNNPEAHFEDGTVIQITPSNYEYFQIAYREYNIKGVS